MSKSENQQKDAGEKHKRGVHKQPQKLLAISSSEARSPDEVLAILGPRNVYLLLIWFAMGTCWALSAMPMMASAFFMDDRGVSCSEVNNGTTFANRKDEDVCMDEADQHCEQQQQMVTITKEFHLSPIDHSLFSVVQLSTSLYLLGVVLGASTLPRLSDRFGRHPLLCISMFFSGLLGCLSSLVPFVQIFLALRFLQGIFWPGMGLTNWVLAYESVPMQLRAHTMCTFGLWWVFGYCLVGPLAAFLPSWRWLAFCASAPALLFSFLYFFTIPESFHWLASVGDERRLKRWLECANASARTFGTPQVVNLSVCDFCLHNRWRTHHPSPSQQSLSTSGGGIIFETRTSPSSDSSNRLSPIASVMTADRKSTIGSVQSSVIESNSTMEETLAAENNMKEHHNDQQQAQTLSSRRLSESPFIKSNHQSSFTGCGATDVVSDCAIGEEETVLNKKRKRPLRWLRRSQYLVHIYTVFFAYLWTCNTFIYYGLSLFSTKLAGNVYVNYVLVGAVELPSYIVSPYFLDKCGRRWFVAAAHFLAACAYLVIVANDLIPRCPIEWLTLAMWLLGKFAISCSFTSIFVYASEVFPTVSRTSNMGICVAISRIGACLVPFVQKMSRILQLGSFCVAALLATLLTLLLPETHRKQLPTSNIDVGASEKHKHQQQKAQ